MSGTPYIKKVAIVGASGNIGSAITTALLASPHAPSITAITRPDSTSTFPSTITVARGAQDDHPFLVRTLTGHQALVLCLGFAAPHDLQHKFIDAAAEAGVEYVFPVEFGSDTDDEVVGKAVPLMVGKKKVRAYIESVGGSKWIGVVNNPWLDYSLAAGMFGISIPTRTATLYTSHDTHVPFTTTTIAQSGRGTAAILLLPEAKLSTYANKLVYLSSFSLTQRDLLDSIQRVTGTVDADWTIDTKDVQERMAEGRKKLGEGDFTGMVDLLYGSVMTRGVADQYRVGTSNQELRLPREELDVVVREVVEGLEGKGKGE